MGEMAGTKGGEECGEAHTGKNDDRLCLTVPEAAAVLGLSRGFAYELARRGELPVIAFGRRLLVPKAALDEMLRMGNPGKGDTV